jgi:four helix bundle protein
MHEFYFEKLRVWNDCRLLVNKIYSLTGNFPKTEEFSLSLQMKRAAVSVRTNIVEGQGRTSMKEQSRFTTISYSSLIEVLDHLITGFDQQYFSEKEYLEIREIIERISRQLVALKKYQLSKQ